MKKCTKCGIEKDESEFCKRKDGKNGLDSQCKNCRRQNLIKLHKNNPEYIKKAKEWRKNNPEKVKEIRKNNQSYFTDYNKIWRKNNPEKEALYTLSNKIDRELITPELIELKKMELKLKRFIKKQKELQNDAS